MRTMTIQNYLNNPAGVGSAAIANRDLVRGDLTKRFETLYTKKRDQFLGHSYRQGEDFFIHVVIPSESDRGNTYDVVIKFFPPSDDPYAKNGATIRNYNIQLFSNSQSFTFTYAYVFDKEKLLVPELRDKFRDETFQPPTTRNPYESISYEKSTFFAIMFILRNEALLSRMYLTKAMTGLSHLKSMVRNTDKVAIEHAKERNKLKDEAAKAKAKSDKKEIRDISIKNPPKSGKIKGSVKPIKPRSKIKPKAKTTSRTALKRTKK